MAAPRSNRRDFLKGRAAADTLANVVDGVLGAPVDEEPLGDSAPASYLVQYARRAMACQFEIYFNGARYPEGPAAALAALDLVDQLENQLSVYRSESEISRLNRQAATLPIEVEPRLFDLLAQAIELHQETQGAFDITAGPLSDIWGFLRRADEMPTASAIEETLVCVGSEHVDLDPQRRTARFTRPGMQINLGSIGKGYALDRCAELLSAHGVNDYLLHGGNSSVLARGSRTAQADEGWAVGLRNPHRPQRRLGEICLRDGALATSGSGTQFFMHEGRRYGHLLDPRTGWPAQGVLSATALAPTAALADALSTAFYVLGPAGTTEYCARHESIAAILLTEGNRAGSVQVHMIGDLRDRWQLLGDD